MKYSLHLKFWGWYFFRTCTFSCSPPGWSAGLELHEGILLSPSSSLRRVYKIYIDILIYYYINQSKKDWRQTWCSLMPGKTKQTWCTIRYSTRNGTRATLTFFLAKGPASMLSHNWSNRGALKNLKMPASLPLKLWVLYEKSDWPRLR